MIYTLTLNPALDRELLVDAITFDVVLRAVNWQKDYGGKGLNVSRLLLGFDAPSLAMGFLGGGTGKILEEGLQSLNISTDFVWVAQETRTNVSIRAASHTGYIKVNEPGPTIEQTDIDHLLEKIAALAKPDDWWVMAGSLPPGCPPDLYREIIELVQAKGGYALLDSSGDALNLGCEGQPFLCKPNRKEAEDLIGHDDLAPFALADAVRAKGPRHVIISLGEDGAVYSGPDDSFRIKPPFILEKNPIGAGDSMVGGMVWALAKKLPFREVAAWGSACGAATASLEGTSLANRAAAERLLPQVQIEERKAF